jgi:hypothetical protein
LKKSGRSLASAILLETLIRDSAGRDECWRRTEQYEKLPNRCYRWRLIETHRGQSARKKTQIGPNQSRYGNGNDEPTQRERDPKPEDKSLLRHFSGFDFAFAIFPNFASNRKCWRNNIAFLNCDF